MVSTISRAAATLPCSFMVIPKINSCKCQFIVSETSALFVNTHVSFFHHNKKKHLLLSTSSRTRAAGSNIDSGNDSIELDVNELIIEAETREDGVEIKIEKTGKRSRRISSKVVVQASLQCLWDILTDYERLADFIPSLAVSKLVEKGPNFARLFQIGQQDLAFGLKFNAQGTIDCFEKDLQTLPLGQRRDIEFKMVEGDFQLFEGKWSVEQEMKGGLQIDSVVGEQESQTTLHYIVDVKPKLWLPVRLVEGRLCNEVKMNLSCIRDEAEKAFRY